MNFSTGLRKHFIFGMLFLVLVACGTSQTPSLESPSESNEITEPSVRNAASLVSLGGLKVVRSEPTQNATFVSTDAPFEFTFSATIKRSSLERGVNLFPGRYDLGNNPKKFNALGLTSVCDGRWKITNPNPTPISFRWDIYKSAEQGVGIVPQNTEVLLQASKGTKTFRLFVENAVQSVKASNNKPCLAQCSIQPGKLLGRIRLDPTTQ